MEEQEHAIHLPLDSARSPERLLREHTWLRGLAQSLLKDRDQAEEALHDVWVKALRNPPDSRDERSTRAWFARVLRNTIHSRGRSAERRRHHERAAAREASESGEAEAAERVELQRDLVDALGRLEPGDRELVVLRYFDGLPPREIARRKGLSGGAVRSRLSRSLQKLRAHLDLRYGDRRRWALLLGRWVHPAKEGLSAATMALWGALGAVGLAGAWVWTTSGSALFQAPASEAGVVHDSLALEAALQPELTPENASLAATDAGQDANARSAIDPKVPPLPAPPPVEHELAFAVRFVDATDRPIPGVTLALPTLPSMWSGLDGDLLRVEPSGEEGLVRAVVRWSQRKVSPGILLEARRDGFTRALLKVDTSFIPPRPDAEAFLGVLRLRAAGAIEGRVVRSDGTVAVGALVGASSEAAPRRKFLQIRSAVGLAPVATSADGGQEIVLLLTQADGAGRFRMDGVPEGDLAVFARGEDTLFSFAAPIEVESGGTTRLPDLELEDPDPRQVVRGIVVDPQGAPLPNIRLELTTVGGSQVVDSAEPVTTDAEGRFRQLIPMGDEFGLAFRDPTGRYQPASYEPVRMGMEPFTVQMSVRAHPAASAPQLVSGRVLGGGRPVRAARVHAHPQLGEGSAWEADSRGLPTRLDDAIMPWVLTDEDGFFELQLDGRPGFWELHAEADGWVRGVAPLARPAPADAELVIELLRGGSIVGRVRVDEGSDPRRVVLVATSGDGHLVRGPVDEAGHYTLSPLHPGSWKVAAQDSESSPRRSAKKPLEADSIEWSVEVREGEQARFDLDLRTATAEQAFEGRLLFGGEAPRGWRVGFFGSDPWRGPRIAKDGSFSVSRPTRTPSSSSGWGRAGM